MNDTATSTIAEPTLELRIEQGKEGLGEPRVLCQVVPNDVMIEQVIERMSNPHILIATSRPRDMFYGDDTDYVSYELKSLQVIPVRNPFVFLTFDAPGRNRVTARVIDISDKSDRKRLDEYCAGSYRSGVLDREDASFAESSNADGDDPVVELDLAYGIRASRAEAKYDVVIDPDLFAAPPAAWKRIVTGHFFNSRQKDQCVTRRQLLFAIPLELVVQPLGLLVRLLSIIGVLLFAKRDIAWRQLFDIRVTALWTDSGYSRWFTDDDGRDRDDWLSKINPVTVLSVLGGSFGLAGILFAVFNIPVHIGTTENTRPWVDLGWWQTYMVVWGVAIAIAVLSTLVGLIGTSFGRLMRSRNSSKYDDERAAMLNQLRAASQATPEWNAVPVKTLSLRFNHLKSKVCKPYAR